MGCNASSPAGTGAPSRKRSGSKIVLGFWDSRGTCRGNVARYMLAYSKAPWEMKTYIMDDSANDKDWTNDKENLMPFCNLPYLIDGEFKVSETYAVHQYIAAKYCPDLLGNTP